MIEVIAHSDAGTVKKVNQDSISAKVIETEKGQCFMGILCDGMGGLSEGELASTTCVKTFMDWFDRNIKQLINQPSCFSLVQRNWEEMIQELNQRIGKYGSLNGINLGTTLLAFLIIGKEYLIVNVGDCRAYRIKEQTEQMTKDHTVVGLDVEKGLITKEEAENDKRRNVLLQCVGASKVVIPDYFRGTVSETDAFLLCSDGFRHVISEEEIAKNLSLANYKGTANMQQKLVECINTIKERGERDNITALVVYYI